MEKRQATCPNCGAHITNMKNCEFCGSLLIRLQQQGINIELSGYKDDNKVFKGLVGALKRNLDLQKSVNHSISVITDIAMEENGGIKPICSVIMCAVSQNDQLFFPLTSNDEGTDGKDHLMIVFSYMPNDISGDELKLRKFRNLDIYELFTENICVVDGVKFYEYAIDFGEDADGAARLISRVLHEIDSLSYETRLDYYTNSGDDIEKNRALLEGRNEIEEKNELASFLDWKSWKFWGVIFLIICAICAFFAD